MKNYAKLVIELHAAKEEVPAEGKKPVKEQVTAPVAPPAEEKVDSYEPSELQFPAFKNFQKKDTAARDAMRLKYTALFLNVIKESNKQRYSEKLERIETTYDAFYKDAFAQAYTDTRKNGHSVAAALKLAGKIAGENACAKLLNSADQANQDYATAMMRFEQNAVDTTSQFTNQTWTTITYERVAKPLPQEPASDTLQESMAFFDSLVAQAPQSKADIPSAAHQSATPSDKKQDALQRQDALASLRTATKLPDAGMPGSVQPLVENRTAAPTMQEPVPEASRLKSVDPETTAFNQFQNNDAYARGLAEVAYAKQNGLDDISLRALGWDFEDVAERAFERSFFDAIGNGVKESDALKLACVEAKTFATSVFEQSDNIEYRRYADFIKQYAPEFTVLRSDAGQTQIGIEYKFQPVAAPQPAIATTVPQPAVTAAVPRRRTPVSMPTILPTDHTTLKAIGSKRFAELAAPPAKPRQKAKIVTKPGSKFSALPRTLRKKARNIFAQLMGRRKSYTLHTPKAEAKAPSAKAIAKAAKKADANVKLVGHHAVTNQHP